MSILSKIQSLITAANNTTGESDTTLTDAVQTLVDGYGQGGGAKIATGTFTLSQAALPPTITHNLGTTKIAAVIYPTSSVIGTEAYDTFFAAFVNWVDLLPSDTEWQFDFSAYNSNQPTQQTATLANEQNRLRIGVRHLTPWTTQTYWYQGEYKQVLMRSDVVFTSDTFKISNNFKMTPATYAYLVVALE